ncbi:MAG: high-affinity branched-chain amino acid ABC transporter permease LivM [Alphaproteobacteria bacterium]|nr:high-affinity branched-chain amino acid ABC transporter permease LivM [Alphaproteobacteria bacterium]
MSAPVKASSAGGEAKVLSPAEIAKDLVITAIITFFILVPIVAIRTPLDQGTLTWHPRFGLAAALCGLVVVGRLALYLFVWNPKAKAALAPADASAPLKAVKGPSLGDRLGPKVAPTLLILAIALPFFFIIIGNADGMFPGWDRRGIDFAITVMLYVMLGWGLNVVVGLAGLLDLGYVAFYAVGAYTYALMATKYLPAWFGPEIKPYAFFISLPIAAILASLWGMILGFPVLRLKGDYLAIVTLAFGEIIYQVLQNWSVFTEGPRGISVPKLTFFGIPFDKSDGGFAATFHVGYNRIVYFAFLYFVILALALLTYFVTKKLRRLPIGRAWEALREDEIACRSLGINTTSTKLTAFAIGAAFGGMAGAFFAVRQEFISPESFKYIESAFILAIVVLGGLGSQIGIVFSAIAIIGATEAFREMEFLKYVLPEGTEPVQFRMLAVGVALVLMMRFRPRGFVTKREPTVYLKEKKAVSGDLVAEGHG